jgi:hypothetical protein
MMVVVQPDANSSSLGDHACWVCGSTDYDATVLGKRLYDASDFVPPGTQRAAHDFHLRECRACGHTWTATDHPSWLTTRAHDFIRYKEPTEHFGQIRDALIGRGVDLATCSLFTFSYKDEPLLEFLRPGAVAGPDVAGLSRDWAPEVDGAPPRRLDLLRRQLDQSNSAQRVVLIRRVLEHVAARELLDEILSLADEHTYLVFDMADFPTLAETTVDFVWNERRHYWSPTDLVRIAGSCGLALTVSISNLRESTVLVIIGGSLKSILASRFKSLLGLGHQLDEVRRRWRLLAHGHSVVVIGASHKGVSLAQVHLNQDPLRGDCKYFLHDDNPSLLGLSAPDPLASCIFGIAQVTADCSGLIVYAVGKGAREVIRASHRTLGLERLREISLNAVDNAS